jgi:hypothetical protein
LPDRRLAVLLFASATLFHATAVFVFNVPNGHARRLLEPAIRWYEGPQTRQGWSLFAPTLDRSVSHVLVRGKDAAGGVSAWYDVTEFFRTERLARPLSPDWALSEGLEHGLALSRSGEKLLRDQGMSVVTRTAAMILSRAVPDKALQQMQIEIQRRAIPAIGTSPTSRVDNARFAWEARPAVAAL